MIGSTGGYYLWYLPNQKLSRIPHPQTLVVQILGDPQFLDSATGYEATGESIIFNVYETLIWYKGGSAATLEPLLASEMPKISPDGLTYTFKIRQNVKFHDGTPLNASAVKYSIDRTILINEPDGPSWMYSPIKGAEAYMASKMTKADADAYQAAGGVTVVDSSTVNINLSRPYSPILYVLAFGGAAIVSPSAVEAHGGVVPGKHNEWMDKNMVGTGPYKFVEWVPKQRIVLDRFDNYWRTPAKIGRVIMQIVPEVGSRELALFTGDADMAVITTANAFDFMQKDPWVSSRKIVVKSDLQLKPVDTGLSVYAGYPTLSVTYIGMNVRIPPLNNTDFRYGLSYAFNYKTFLDDVNNGFGIPGRGPIPKGLFGYDESVFQFSYDPAKAKEYFLKAKAAGAYKDGMKLGFYYNAGNELRRRGGLLLKDSIDALNVGFSVDVNELDWPTFLYKGRHGDLPLFLIGWTVDYADPNDFEQPFGDSRGTVSNRVALNIPGLNDKIAQAAATVDPALRQKMYSNITNIINKAAYYIWVGQTTQFMVMRDWVQMTWDPDTNTPTQSNPMYGGLYYYYTMWKGYP
ncbi:MAG TPA: ABC transporter substrate-binding protein [Candidatus Bathyarchaeia archaeon]|nr:ABC transporter substrate-binding protein [Candidatus Bathyarchaeia archaeon]